MSVAFALAGIMLHVAGQASVPGLAGARGRDQEVVAAVLEDLAAYRGKDSPIDGTFSPDPLTLDPTPSRHEVTVDDVLRERRPEKWEALSAEDRPALREAAMDLVAGIKGPMVRFTAGSAHVPLYAGVHPSKLSVFGFRQAPIQASLPGYSKDRRLAILTLSIPWSIHVCHGTYVLFRDQTGWHVRVREFTCYM